VVLEYVVKLQLVIQFAQRMTLTSSMLSNHLVEIGGDNQGGALGEGQTQVIV